MLATDSIDPSVKIFSFLIVVQQHGTFVGVAMAEAAGVVRAVGNGSYTLEALTRGWWVPGYQPRSSDNDICPLHTGL
jgi:hypothetical protein